MLILQSWNSPFHVKWSHLQKIPKESWPSRRPKSVNKLSGTNVLLALTLGLGFPTVLDSKSTNMCWTQRDGEKQHTFKEEGKPWNEKKQWEAWKRKRRYRGVPDLGTLLFLPLANTLTWPKPNRLPTTPSTFSPHEHHPQNTSLSLLSSLEGRIFVDSIWLENNVHSSLLPCPRGDKQDCGLPQRLCVCVCVCDLCARHSNQKWNEKTWTQKKQKRNIHSAMCRCKESMSEV